MGSWHLEYTTPRLVLLGFFRELLLEIETQRVAADDSNRSEAAWDG